MIDIRRMFLTIKREQEEDRIKRKQELLNNPKLNEWYENTIRVLITKYMDPFRYGNIICTHSDIGLPEHITLYDFYKVFSEACSNIGFIIGCCDLGITVSSNHLKEMINHLVETPTQSNQPYR